MSEPRGTSPSALLMQPRHWPGALALALLWMVALLPYACAVRLGAGLGRLLKFFSPYRRRVLKTNLQLCFPHHTPRQQAASAQRYWPSFGASVVELAASWWMPARHLRGKLDLVGLEHLHAALARGAGVLLVSGHFACPDFAGRLLLPYQDLCFTFQELRNPFFDAVMRRARARHCACLIHRHDLRGMVRALKSKRVVWYAPDQDIGPRHSVFAPFFGIPAATLTATSRLVRLTGAAVLPFEYRRLPEARGYRVVIHPPWANFPSGDDTADAERFNAWLEAQVRAVPAQYLWLHRRFKTRPPGEPLIYPRKPRRVRRAKNAAA